MVIRRSSSREVVELVAALAGRAGGASRAREVAIARLRVIGTRAVPHLLESWSHTTSADVRAAVLQALEGSADPRVTALVLEGLADASVEVRAAAASAARCLLEGGDSDEVLDGVTGLALDRSQPAHVRVAAITALQDLPARLVAPVLGPLHQDADPAVRAAADRDLTVDDTPASILADAAAGDLPADPPLLAQALASAARTTPLPTLHRLVTVLREREVAVTDPRRRHEWAVVRGGVHLALAARGSRVALYDLRESVRGADVRLPEGYLSAIAEIGDREALDDLAAAYAQAAAGSAADWAGELRAAARAIVRRERLTARHAALKRLHARWGATATALLGGAKGTG